MNSSAALLGPARTRTANDGGAAEVYPRTYESPPGGRNTGTGPARPPSTQPLEGGHDLVMNRHALTHALIGFSFLAIAAVFTVQAVTLP